MIESFNNKTDKVGDDLKKTITNGSKIDIAAGIFSIYGYESLKKELLTLERKIKKEKQFNRKVELNKFLLERQKQLKSIKGAIKR